MPHLNISTNQQLNFALTVSVGNVHNEMIAETIAGN